MLPLFDREHELPAALIYGSGLSTQQCSLLRTADIDLERRHLRIYDAQGRYSHTTILPCRLVEPLRRHLEERRRLHIQDFNRDFARAPLPDTVNCDQAEYSAVWKY